MLEIEIARLLGVSPAAVSRYLKLKRGNFRVERIEEATRMINELAEAILMGRELSVDEEIRIIASKLMAMKLPCDLHESVHPSLDSVTCRICSRLFR